MGTEPQMEIRQHKRVENRQRTGRLVKEERKDYWYESWDDRKRTSNYIIEWIRVVSGDCKREKKGGGVWYDVFEKGVGIRVITETYE